MRSLADLTAGLRPVAALVTRAGGEPRSAETETEAASPLGALVWRPALRQRNALVYAAGLCRWSMPLVYAAGLCHGAALAGGDPGPRPGGVQVAEAGSRQRRRRGDGGGELAAFAGLLLGTGGLGLSVAYVAPGHSRRPDCLSQRLAVRVAAALRAQYVQAFADRFVSGCSHPKEFKRLPPLQVLARPTGPVVLVDDLASSGWHLEEAARVLRQTALLVLALAWLGGTTQG